MTIIITDDDVRRLLPMRECIDAMRVAFREFAAGERGQPAAHALSGQASRSGPATTWPTSMSARCRHPASPACAPARRSSGPRPPRTTGAPTRTRRPSTGASSSCTASRPPSRWRCCTNSSCPACGSAPPPAVAVDAIARPDAAHARPVRHRQAGAQRARSDRAGRPIDRVNVYSPNAEHRSALARDLSRDGIDGHRGGGSARRVARRRYRVLRHHAR